MKKKKKKKEKMKKKKKNDFTLITLHSSIFVTTFHLQPTQCFDE